MMEKIVELILNRNVEELLKIKEEELDENILLHPLQIENRIQTVAEWMIDLGYIFKNYKFLSLKVNEHGETVAHRMAILGHVFDPAEDEICQLEDNYHNSVLEAVFNIPLIFGELNETFYEKFKKISLEGLKKYINFVDYKYYSHPEYGVIYEELMKIYNEKVKENQKTANFVL